MSYEVSMVLIVLITIFGVAIRVSWSKRWCQKCNKSTKYLSKKEKHICGKCSEKYAKL